MMYSFLITAMIDSSTFDGWDNVEFGNMTGLINSIRVCVQENVLESYGFITATNGRKELILLVCR